MRFWTLGFWSRLFWTGAQLLWSATMVWVLVVFRRRSNLVFTHHGDIDADGRDQQMGPLVDALIAGGEGLVEVARIPLSPALLGAIRLKRRPFLSQAALLAPSWLWSLGSPARATALRRWAAGCLLRLLRPRVVYLIDESGSGQPLLQAARRLGIRVIGIQHGDFAGNPQYCAGPTFDRQAADVLCVWSSWYRDRLLDTSPIYTADNVRVTGRLRYPTPEAAPRDPSVDDGVLRILVLGERDAAFWTAMDPFVRALTDRRDFAVEVRRHPAETDSDSPPSPSPLSPSLAVAVKNSDVVLGSGSSALLEAVYWSRAIIVCATLRLGDPAGLVRDGLAIPCENPNDLADLCRELCELDRSAQVRTAHDMVWGDIEVDAVHKILSAGAGLASSNGNTQSEMEW